MLDGGLELLGDALDLLLEVLQILRLLLRLAVFVVARRGLFALAHLVLDRARLRGVGGLLRLALRLLHVIDALQVLRQIAQLRLGDIPGVGVLLGLDRVRPLLRLLHLGERLR